MPSWKVDPALGDFQLAERYGAHPGSACSLLQDTWMGRSGFRQNADGSFLVLKGIGPGPGSEWMRGLIDQNARESHGGDGGCLRLRTGTPYPLLVPFGRLHGAWRVHSARPEGMARFPLCLLEAEVASIYQRLEVPVARPLFVSRNRTCPPWDDGNSSSMGRYLRATLPQAIRDHLELPEIVETNSIVVGRQVYAYLDAGILARRVRSPYRISNVCQAVIDGDAESLSRLAQHLRQICGTDAPGESIVARLARTAGLLFCEGAIHGQLHIHHQDITLAGELADLDCTTFLRSLPKHVEDIPFGPSQVGDGYQRCHDRLQGLGARHEVALASDPDRRYQTHFVGSTASDGWRRTQIASALLRQLFDLYNQGALAADRMALLEGRRLDAPDRIRLRMLFVVEAATVIQTLQSRSLFHWCLEHGWEKLVSQDLATLGRRTLYGWACPGVQLDFVDLPGDTVRSRFVQNEVEAFFRALAAEVEGHSADTGTRRIVRQKTH